MSLGRLNTPVLVSAFAALALSLSWSPEAKADGAVAANGKGTVGGALLGGEVVAIGMGVAGVHASWPYYVFTPLGMVGGGLLGFAVDQANPGGGDTTTTSKPAASEPPMYMLAGGMALVIPALVVALNATAYHPPEGERSEPANNEPSAAPPPPGAPPGPTSQRAPEKESPRVAHAVRPHVPVSLFDVYRGKLALGVPAFEIRPLYTQREIAEYGVGQGTELKVPVFQAMF